MSRTATLPLRLSTRYSQLERSQCLHRPSNRTQPHETLHHRPRWTPATTSPFSTSQCRRKSAQTLVKPSMKQPAQQSMSRARKEQEQTMLASGNFPDDIGLLPDTFILPRNPRERYSWAIRKKWAYTRVFEWISTFQLRYFTRRSRSRVTPKSQLPSLAADLHTRMLSAFAAGDLTPVQSSLAQGLLNSLKSRLSLRPPQTLTAWSLLSTLSPPKLVSYKPVLLPTGSKASKWENWNLQAVVRLHTRQSLQNLKRGMGRGADGRMMEQVLAEGRLEVKEVVEYVVLQRVWRKGRAGEWGMWGFAEEMTVARLKKEQAKKLRAGAGSPVAG